MSNDKLNVQQIANDASEQADVCIIGTGAAGSVLAYELSKTDKKVVMLEKGGYYDMDYIKSDDRTEEELAKLWKNKGTFLSQNISVNVGQGECVGGSTMINYGICFRIPEPVFVFWKRAFGIRITRDELDKAYSRVENALHVTRITNAGRCHELFEKGCKRLGYSGDWMDKAYIQGVGKMNALVAFLERAKFEKTMIYPNCTVYKIIVRGKRGFMIKGIYQHPETGVRRTVTVESRILIIAAGAIGSSEILLRNNIANGNGEVGGHLSLHPSTSVVAEFDEKIDGDEGMAMAYYCDQFSMRKTEKMGFMIESVFVPPSQLSITMPSFGEENRKYMKKYDHYAMAGVLVHDEPSGTVSLNWHNEAVIDYTLSDTDQMKILDGLKEGARIFFAAGAKNVITGHIKKTVLHSVNDLRMIDRRGAGLGSLLIASVHPQGGNRMGEDNANSVVNSFCETHEVPNLFVCDASVFPTSIGVNPQLTVMALASIAADHINNL